MFSATRFSHVRSLNRLFIKGIVSCRRSRVGLARAALLLAAVLTAIVAVAGRQPPFIPNGVFFMNPGGASQTYSTTGGIDLANPFFQSLGTNGRSCATCHQPSDGMSVSAANVERRFVQTKGEV